MKISPYHVDTLRRMSADLDPVRGHESWRQKDALHAVLKALDEKAANVTADNTADKSIEDIIAWCETVPNSEAHDASLSPGKVITGTLVVIAPEIASEEQMLEFVKSAGATHDGPVIILSHNWQAMSGDELRAELDRIEKSKTHRSNGGIRCDVDDGPCACGAWHKQPENILNKSDKVMLDLLDTH